MPQGLPGATRPSSPVLPRTGVAWAAILLLVAAVTVLQVVAPRGGEGGGKFPLRVMEQQVRIQYGIRGLADSLGAVPVPDDLEALRKAIGTGPPAVRLRFAVVAGDLAGPAAARAELDRLEGLLRKEGRKLEGEEAEVERTLRALYAGDGSVDALPQDRREVLRRGLGWFGDLALAPEGSPDRAAVLEGADRLALILLGCGLAALLLLGTAFAAALLYWLRVLARGSRFRFEPGTSPSGFYAETFAAWLAWFLALSIGARALQEAASDPAVRTGALFAVPVLSLAALGWPVLRGIPFARVREDLGLRLSGTPVRDVLAGIGCWVLGLPVLFLAGIATFTALAASGLFQQDPEALEGPTVPGHPVVEELAGGFSWALVVVLACVLAPIVEETFFRGALYRHLRDATAGRGRAASVAISALVSGLVFGSIHPQGVFFIPLLAAVAWPLAHAREWRDSLVAPMAAHALHNAIVTGFAWLLLGG